ncbi:MAG: hypothetical protein AB8G05_11905 [Oligoflexales bacterium]
MEPTIKFLSDSDTVKERQLKAFAASVSAFGQKLPFDMELLKSVRKALLTLIDPSVLLTAKQLGELTQSANLFVLRSLDSFASSTYEQTSLKNLLARGIDVGILKKNDYFEMPLMRLILLNALGSKELDLSDAMPWGGISENLDSLTQGLSPGMEKVLKQYQINSKLSEELGRFNSFVAKQLLGKVAGSELNFVADGVRLGLIYKLKTSFELNAGFLLELLQNSFARDCGQVLFKVVHKTEIQISYFVNNIEDLSLNQSKHVAWFIVGANKLVDAYKV